jgi:2-dehydro-3-deoxyphosphogluconate aldolase / (4S)-4-hydroxy-2-oxoglutarate aldolase
MPTPTRPRPAGQLIDTGVVPILRPGAADSTPRVAETLVKAGMTCLEVTLTVPGALRLLPGLKAALPQDVALGVGTVTTAAEAEAAAAAGAAFLVSPAVCPDVMAFATAHGLPCYPGAWTPTEVLSAWQAGATAVKLFPAASGGPGHLRRIRDPLPEIPLMPTGGVAIDQVSDYLAAGAIAVGMGSPLLGDALEGGSLSALTERSHRVLDEVARGRDRR